MSVDLSPTVESLILSKVREGTYTSPTEVVEEALQLLEERDRQRIEQLQKLRADVSIGLSQLDRGESVPGEQVFQDLRERSARLRERNV